MLLPAFSQKVPVHVIRSGEVANSEWKILDEEYRLVFAGSEFFKDDSVTFSLEVNRRYLFSISLTEEFEKSKDLFKLYIDNEAIILVRSDADIGDHFLPFFTGVRKPETKITGGTNALISEFPWQVFLSVTISSNSKATCGGSIIADNWILTAAHCVKDNAGRTVSPSAVTVKAGANNPLNVSEGDLYSAAEVIAHENYNDESLENDIALIRLSDPIDNPVAAPVKIVTSEDVAFGAIDPGVMTWVTGWGIVTAQSNEFPTSLQKVQLPIVKLAQAATVWRNINATVLMAGYLNGNKDACSGDSGGPLVVPVLGGYRLAGLVSWGSSLCNTYGAYTNISLFRNWITSNTGIVQSFIPPHPAGDTIICPGQTSNRYTVASVSGASSYEWDLLPDNAGSVSGSSTGATVSWNTGFEGTADLIYRLTRNGEVSDWSRLRIKVVPVTRFLSQSNDTTICADQPVTLEIEAEGYNLVYSWFRNGTLVQSGPDFQLNLLPAGVDDSGSYRVEITGSCGTALSGNINLTVYPLTNITNLTPDSDVNFGNDLSLDVDSEGHNLTYQWQKDTIPLAGATSSTFVLENVNAADIGNYTVTVSGTCGTETSDSIYVFVTGRAATGGPDVFLWPSITSDDFNIAISGDSFYSIRIYNIAGMLMRSYTDLRFQNTIDVSLFPKGTYIIVVYNRDFRKSLKLIKF